MAIQLLLFTSKRTYHLRQRISKQVDEVGGLLTAVGARIPIARTLSMEKQVVQHRLEEDSGGVAGEAAGVDEGAV